ncbi:hypothetical protein D3C84_701060 [compost metagenome]
MRAKRLNTPPPIDCAFSCVNGRYRDYLTMCVPAQRPEDFVCKKSPECMFVATVLPLPGTTRPCSTSLRRIRTRRSTQSSTWRIPEAKPHCCRTCSAFSSRAGICSFSTCRTLTTSSMIISLKTESHLSSSSNGQCHHGCLEARTTSWSLLKPLRRETSLIVVTTLIGCFLLSNPSTA